MLKKIKDFFIEEVEEIEEIDDISQFEAEPVLKAEPHQEVTPEDNSSRVSFINLSEEKEIVETPLEKEIVEEGTTKPVEVVELEEEKEAEYEFSPVISPIFGVTNQERVLLAQSEVTFHWEKTKIESQEESILGTVISPIYGVNRPISESKAPKETEEVVFDSEYSDDYFEPELNIDESIDDLIEDYYYEVEEEEEQFTLFSQEHE